MPLLIHIFWCCTLSIIGWYYVVTLRVIVAEAIFDEAASHQHRASLKLPIINDTTPQWQLPYGAFYRDLEDAACDVDGKRRQYLYKTLMPQITDVVWLYQWNDNHATMKLIPLLMPSKSSMSKTIEVTWSWMPKLPYPYKYEPRGLQIEANNSLHSSFISNFVNPKSIWEFCQL